MSMVPGGGQTSIENSEYQLYAYLRPARSVGGDLYYFELHSNHLHFIIGDVSDKGVPAALFMAKTSTLYTRDLKEDLSPGAIFSRMNEALCNNNDEFMFVTALCGTLDLDSGRLVVANAGHMHPIQNGAGAYGELPVEGGPPLGLMEGREYPNVEHRLAAGTRLLMYTDGISEAFNPEHETYGEERLLDFVEQSNAPSATVLGEQVLADVESFVGDAEQSDDISLMVIQYGT
jgi:sigma-B regulation protein RsbU (phosphoserine phosphatase)